MRLSTANNNRKRAERRLVYAKGFAFHIAQVIRLTKAGRLDKLQDTIYTRKVARRHKAERRRRGRGVL